MRKALLTLVVLAVAMAGCWWWMNHQSPQSEKLPQMDFGRQTAVQVQTARTANVPLVINAIGTAVPNRLVKVVSQIDGRITGIHFTEGVYLKAGDLLATIDTRTYAASLEQHKGELAVAQAQLKEARTNLARYEKLVKQGSVSVQDRDTQQSLVNQYEGAVRTARGQIADDEINLGYGRITAPVDGWAGLRGIDEGNVVSANATDTPITTIAQTSPIAVTFSIPQIYAPDVAHALRTGESLRVTALDQSGRKELAVGTVCALENAIDVATGTIKLKAEFPNEDGALFPNQALTVQMSRGMIADAVVIPSSSVLTTTAGSFVYKVNEDNTVKRTAVTLSSEVHGAEAVALSGVSPGDRLVTSGIDSVNDGMRVTVVEPREVDLSVLDVGRRSGPHP